MTCGIFIVVIKSTKRPRCLPRRAGFALVELLVAIGLFLVVATIAVGGFSRALRALRQNSDFVAASGTVSLSLEQISREIRTGYDFCVNGQTCEPALLTFKNAKSDTITYRLNEGSLERVCAGACDGDPGESALTPRNVVVSNLLFTVFGNQPADGNQPRVTVSVSVAPRDSSQGMGAATLQTTVSSRIPLDT